MPGPYPPNAKLRAARVQRNWTLDDAARELRTLMASRGETQMGVTLYHVARWEGGARRPGMRYRRYLCLLYGLRADQLGFLPGDYPEPPLASQARQAAPWETNGHATRPWCSDDELKLLNLSRRKLLAASGLLGAAIGAETAERFTEPLERAVRVASGRAAADDAIIADLTTITASYERAYSKAPAGMLIAPVHTHIQLVKSVLEQPMLPEQREALLRTGSQITARMAMLRFFDQHDHAAGRRWLNESITMGEETSDTGMHVFGLLQAAQQFNYSGQGGTSVQLMEHARKLAARKCTPNAVSWTLAVQAEAHATLHQPEAGLRLLGQAEEAQPRSRSGYEPPWSERWSRRHIAGFIGAVHMRLDRPGPARAALHEVLAGQDVSAVKYRSINLVDLAMTHAQEAEVEQACDLAGKALDIAGPMNFGTTLERMSGLRRRLARWPANRAVKHLDERLQTIGSA